MLISALTSAETLTRTYPHHRLSGGISIGEYTPYLTLVTPVYLTGDFVTLTRTTSPKLYKGENTIDPYLGYFVVNLPLKTTSGEGGIRTHGALRLTRSPGARTRPDYATSPLIPPPWCSWRRKLYHGRFFLVQRPGYRMSPNWAGDVFQI